MDNTGQENATAVALEASRQAAAFLDLAAASRQPEEARAAETRRSAGRVVQELVEHFPHLVIPIENVVVGMVEDKIERQIEMELLVARVAQLEKDLDRERELLEIERVERYFRTKTMDKTTGH